MTKRFEEVLFDTPECHDFRRLASGEWVAYSTRTDELGVAIRAIGKSIREALDNLQAKLK